ncbi:MAG: carboxypeptidase-like regulatory domain-containing protein, partial [Prevotella sp.]|nr:carboxypeptidase-like regulatory domain-containing protein [Prevotella sp.]
MKQLKKRFLSFALMLVCTTMMYAQTQISGTVVDATGEPIIGATVMVKGTTSGTITDFDGAFTIKVN